MEVLQSIKLTEFTTAIERQDLYLLEPENNDTNLIYNVRSKNFLLLFLLQCWLTIILLFILQVVK